MSYTVSPPSGYAEDLIISPASGTLAEGQSVTISVTWESSATMDASLSTGPDGPGVSVSYEAPTPAPSPTPSTEPSTASPGCPPLPASRLIELGETAPPGGVMGMPSPVPGAHIGNYVTFVPRCVLLETRCWSPSMINAYF